MDKPITFNHLWNLILVSLGVLTIVIIFLFVYRVEYNNGTNNIAPLDGGGDIYLTEARWQSLNQPGEHTRIYNIRVHITDMASFLTATTTLHSTGCNLGKGACINNDELYVNDPYWSETECNSDKILCN